MSRYWVTGPSGSGKTFHKEAFEQFGVRATDLDDIGYRTDESSSHWLISVDVLKYWLSREQKTDAFYFGIANNWNRISRLEWDGVVILNPPSSTILRNRAIRGRVNTWETTERQRLVELGDQSDPFFGGQFARTLASTNKVVLMEATNVEPRLLLSVARRINEFSTKRNGLVRYGVKSPSASDEPSSTIEIPE